MPAFTTISHIDFSVVDAESSAQWYCTVLGLSALKRVDFDDRIMIVLAHKPTGMVIGLNQHTGTKETHFDERNVGLDHVGFGVENREQLDELERRLTEEGVEHSPVADTQTGAALVFRDPDNIQLEFWWSRPRS